MFWSFGFVTPGTLKVSVHQRTWYCTVLGGRGGGG